MGYPNYRNIRYLPNSKRKKRKSKRTKNGRGGWVVAGGFANDAGDVKQWFLISRHNTKSAAEKAEEKAAYSRKYDYDIFDIFPSEYFKIASAKS